MNKYAYWPSLRLYDKLGVPYVLNDFGDYTGPLWTGHCMMLNVDDEWGDEGFLHELFHWMLASKSQRRYADFKLGRWVNASSDPQTSFATSSTKEFVTVGHPAPVRSKLNQGWGEQVLTVQTGSFQERIAVDAMAFYGPLVGLCDWGEPTEYGHACFEFNGFYACSSNGEARKHAREVHKHIVSKLYPKVGLDAVYAHLPVMFNFEETS